jgi:hypothetical protein
LWEIAGKALSGHVIFKNFWGLPPANPPRKIFSTPTSLIVKALRDPCEDLKATHKNVITIIQ